MIEFQSLAIQGFRSFEADQIFRFPKMPLGFYLVTGKNLVEPDLGANGVGKSGLWDALCWVCYGKTVRGLKAGPVANRKGEHMPSVCLEFLKDGALYGLTRTWNPNTCTIDEEGKDPRPIPQEEIDALLGLSYEGFLYAVIFGQFNALFFDLSPTEKLRVLSEFLDLEVWSEAASRAGDQLRAANELRESQQRKADQAAGKLEALEVALKQTRDASQAAASATVEAVKKLREQSPRLKREVTDAEDRLQELEVRAEASLKAARAAEVVLAQLDDTRSDLRARLARDHARVAQAEGVEAALVDRIERMERLEGECPACLQKVSEQHQEHALAELDRQLEDAKTARDAADAQEEETETTLKALEKRIQAAIETLDAHREESSALSAKVISANRRLTEARADLSGLSKRIEETQNRPNPHAATLKRLEEEVRTASASIDTLKSSLDKTRAKTEAFEYWTKRFKDVRLWIVEQALTELEVHINNALDELGLHGYTIRFDIERPRSDGAGVIRGFQVMIYSPESPDPIPWESFSGGETQRLRMAGAVGISDLICARKGFECNIEVWDEPTAHLSQEGIDDLLEYLGTRARTRRKQVWLVDHRSLNSGDFDGEVLMTKTVDGSKIKQFRAQPVSRSNARKKPVVEAPRTRVRSREA